LLNLLDELGLLLLTAGILREKDREGEEDDGQQWRRKKRGLHGPDYLTMLGGGLPNEDAGTLETAAHDPVGAGWSFGGFWILFDQFCGGIWLTTR
jgi:hypothetical protein